MKRLTTSSLIAAAALALTLATVTPALATGLDGGSPTINYVALGNGVPSGVGVGTAKAYPALLDGFSRRLHGVSESEPFASFSSIGRQIATFEADHADGMADVTTVTLTVGVDEVPVMGVAGSCLQGSTCIAENSGYVDMMLASAPGRIATALAKVRDKFPNAKTYVSGYYELFGTRRYACEVSDGFSINRTDMDFVNDTARKLNAVIRDGVRTAARGGMSIEYVNAAAAFEGHGLCDWGRSWVIGADDLNTFGYPTAVGQAAYAGMFAFAGVR